VGWTGALALTGFILVAVAQVSNMILARGLAGAVPAFSLAFFRWTIIAAGLAPFAIAEIRQGKIALRQSAWLILATGFLGMFLCGGPVAGQSTTAIHIALIMALSPVVVLLIASLLGIERIGALQIFGTVLALVGALIIISAGQPREGLG
jgi:drug/metabolite transporter (DMT)-like permease